MLKVGQEEEEGGVDGDGGESAEGGEGEVGPVPGGPVPGAEGLGAVAVGVLDILEFHGGGDGESGGEAEEEPHGEATEKVAPTVRLAKKRETR